MFALLRAVALHPVEWEEAVARTRKASPPVSEVVQQLISDVQAVVAILTPDETVTLRPEFSGTGAAEPRARPNVIFEAGIAWDRYPGRTVLVQMGPHRPISDIVGLYWWDLTGDPEAATGSSVRSELPAVRRTPITGRTGLRSAKLTSRPGPSLPMRGHPV